MIFEIFAEIDSRGQTLVCSFSTWTIVDKKKGRTKIHVKYFLQYGRLSIKKRTYTCQIFFFQKPHFKANFIKIGD